MSRKGEIDLTTSPILKGIILFTLPIIATNLLQQCFNVADVIVVGQFCGDESLAAVGSNGAIINLILVSLIGISVGLNIVMARAVGRKDPVYANRAMHTSLLFAVTVGLVVAVLGFFLSGAILSLTKLDPSIYDKAVLYLRVYFLGAPALMIYNFGAAALQSKGDSKSSLVFMIAAGITNVGLNLLLVIVFNLDVLGVAIATVVSETLSATLIIIKLLREKDFSKLEFKKLRFYGRELKDVLKNGIPSMLNGMFFSISNVIIQTTVNNLGPLVTTANSVAQNVETFVYNTVYAFHTTAVTIVSQNFGAGNFGRIKKSVGALVSCITVSGLAMGLTLYALAGPMCGIFSPDPNVVPVAMVRMKYVMALEFMCGIMDCGAGCLRGLGYSTIAAIVSLLGACVFRIIWIYTAFAANPTLDMLYMSYPISWALTIVAQFSILYFAYKKQKAQYFGKMRLLEAQRLSNAGQEEAGQTQEDVKTSAEESDCAQPEDKKQTNA